MYLNDMNSSDNGSAKLSANVLNSWKGNPSGPLATLSFSL